MGIYIGHKKGKSEIFASKDKPTKKSHGKRYNSVSGPYKSKKSAKESYGRGLR